VSAETTFDVVGSLSPRDAAAEALSRLLLERLEARVFGGKARDRAVRLEAVFPDWPDAETQLCTPCASIADVTIDADDFDPVDDDASFDDELGLALRVQEQRGEFSVDLWATDREERRAVKAAFLAVFRSGVSRDGLAVIVPLPAEAVPPAFRSEHLRWHVRLTIEEPPRNIESGQGALEDSWRSQARVAWEAELVTAIEATRLEAVIFNVDVTKALTSIANSE
jgi:hypothetical protein